MRQANVKNEEFFLQLIEEGKLKISKKGIATNLVTGRVIGKPPGKGTGFEYRKLTWMCPVTRKIKQVLLHRLVWARYKGIPEDPTLVINHKDGDKMNCALSNLELVTKTRNNKHAVEKGLVYVPQGEERENAAFTDAQVRKLRRLYSAKKITRKEIAKKYGVHTVTALYMLQGKTYKHVS